MDFDNIWLLRCLASVFFSRINFSSSWWIWSYRAIPEVFCPRNLVATDVCRVFSQEISVTALNLLRIHIRLEKLSNVKGKLDANPSQSMVRREASIQEEKKVHHTCHLPQTPPIRRFFVIINGFSVGFVLSGYSHRNRSLSWIARNLWSVGLSLQGHAAEPCNHKPLGAGDWFSSS